MLPTTSDKKPDHAIDHREENTPDETEVLRRMLRTPPQPHKKSKTDKAKPDLDK